MLLRSIDGAVCPDTGREIKVGGTKYNPHPVPCVNGKGFQCACLIDGFAGLSKASVHCSFKGRSP
jgi:hypothetical protein